MVPVWALSWVHFSPFWGPRSLLEGDQHRRRRFPRNSTKTNRKSTKMPPGRPPKATQNRPKSLPRGHFSALQFRPRFGIDFGSHFGSPRAPLWAPFWRPKSVQKSIEFPTALQVAPRSPQDPPRPPQGRPKTPQEGPRTPPRGPQDPPDPPKCLPRPPPGPS